MAACVGAAPAAQRGELDLTAWDFASQGALGLDGEWQFVAGRLVGPAEPWPADSVTLMVPGSWRAATGSGQGVGTYRLRVACQAGQPLALALPFQHAAAAWFANGRAIASQGRPGIAGEHRAEIRQQLVRLDAANCPLELRAQVSNQELFRGGLMRSAQLGTAAQLEASRERGTLIALLVLGAIAVVGLFALFFFLLRRRERVGLYFGIFCLQSALTLGTSGERVLQPVMLAIPFELQLRLLFLNWFVGIFIYALLVRELFPRQTWRRPVQGFVVVNAALAIACLAVPLRWVAWAGPAVQASSALLWVFIILVVSRACLARERGAWVLFASIGALTVASLHDVVFYQHLLAFAALPYGLAAVVLAPAFLLARRMSRALATEDLRAIEQRQRADLIVSSTKAGVLDWDGISGRATYSERFREMLGYPVGDDAPALPSLRDLMHPDERERVDGSFMRQLRDRSVRNGVRTNEPIDFRLRCRDGDYLWVHGEGISLCDASGRTLRFIGSFIDISDRMRHESELALQVRIAQQAREALALEQDRLRLLVRSTKAGFGDWDAVRDTVTYTDRFIEMLGYPPGTDTRTWPSIFDMMHPDDREAAHEEFRRMIRRKATGGEGEPGAPMSYRLRRADGSYVWIHAEGISQTDDSGRTVRFITSYLDVTRFREQEEQLRRSRDQVAEQAQLLEKQNEALKENVRLREEVERIGRHDIKTPLNSIVAVPRLLREERKLGPEADELLGIVERAGYRILSMVNLSLDLYKMEQGTYVFRPDAVDLIDLAGKVIADMRVHAESKRVTVRQTVRHLPFAWAEELLCYSLLANLLKNAVEASPEGAQVWVRPEASDGQVRIRIHNQGAVPAAIRANFFEKYASLGKASGTGLGTYSAKLMARVQDGDVAMETSDTDGTTVTVVLKEAPEGAMPATTRHIMEKRGVEPAVLAALPPTRVLLVDDDEYNLLIVRRFLPTPPFTVETAINGRVAVAAVAAHWPDLVFMDLDMPVMGGMQAVREMRAFQRDRSLAVCRIIALSSHDDEDTRRQAIEAGFDRYLTKPVTREAIQETLMALRGPAPPAPIATQAPRSQEAATPRRQDPVAIDPDVLPLLGDFLGSRRALIEALPNALAQGDRESVRRMGHQLAGSFALYGFAWASREARWIEHHAQQVDPVALRTRLEGLATHLDEVQASLGHPDIMTGQQPRGDRR